MIELSSGEHKKLQLVKAFWLKPQILIIDQPYTGLEVKSRKNVNQIFENLTQEGIKLLLINNDDEVPSCINRFAEIKNGSFLDLKYENSSMETAKEKEEEKKPISDEELELVSVLLSFSFTSSHIVTGKQIGRAHV